MKRSADSLFTTTLTSAEGVASLEGFRIEDEVKVLKVDPQHLVRELETRDGKVIFDGVFYDEYFDVRGADLKKLVGDWPRIRHKYFDGRMEFELSLKDGRVTTESGGTEALESKSFIFDSYDKAMQALRAFLERVGVSSSELYVYSAFGKHRTSVRQGNVQVDIDTPQFLQYDGKPKEDLRFIPPYAEFEVLHDKGATSEEKKALAEERDALMRELNLEPAPREAQGTVGKLVEYYRTHPELWQKNP